MLCYHMWGLGANTQAATAPGFKAVLGRNKDVPSQGSRAAQRRGDRQAPGQMWVAGNRWLLNGKDARRDCSGDKEGPTL